MDMKLVVAVVLAAVVISAEGHFDRSTEVNREEILQHLLSNESTIADGCECVEYNCGCCGRIVLKKVEFDETICVNVSYLPKEYGVRVTLTLNDFVLVNQSISATNPPPLCAGVPHIKELSLCIRVYNLSVSNLSFSGCVDLEAHILHVIDEKYDLGCFKIGDKAKVAMMQHIANMHVKNRGSMETKIDDRLLYDQKPKRKMSRSN